MVCRLSTGTYSDFNKLRLSSRHVFFSVIQFSNDVDGVLLIYVAFFSKRILSSKALNFIKKRLKFVNFENVCFCADNAFLSDQ